VSDVVGRCLRSQNVDDEMEARKALTRVLGALDELILDGE
jgi:hypothetical protein